MKLTIKSLIYDSLARNAPLSKVAYPFCSGVIYLTVAFGLLVFLQISEASPSAAYSPPSQITVWMYRLTGAGGIQPPPTLCSSVDRSYGCTAISSYAYPYSTNPVTIPIETDYLLDVVPKEVIVEAFHPTAIQAQAIAARSYA